ncbi:hypothetical protein ACFLWB_00555 [Chloroflexota bacterium]
MLGTLYIGLTDVNLNEFYVFELSGEDYYLHASYSGDVEVEIESEESHALDRRFELKKVTLEVLLEVECNIHKRKLIGLKLEKWDFV